MWSRGAEAEEKEYTSRTEQTQHNTQIQTANERNRKVVVIVVIASRKNMEKRKGQIQPVIDDAAPGCPFPYSSFIFTHTLSLSFPYPATTLLLVFYIGRVGQRSTVILSCYTTLLHYSALIIRTNNGSELNLGLI